jgi:hypothetical protein
VRPGLPDPPRGRRVVVVVPPSAASVLLDVEVGSSVVLDDEDDELEVELLLDELDDVPSARTSCPSSPSLLSASAAVSRPTTAMAATRPAIARPRAVSEVHQVPIGPP